MAGTITHYKIAKNIIDKLNIDIDKDIYLLACQGHDLLYFIKLYELPKFSKYQKDVDILQEHKFGELIKEFERGLIKDNDKKLKSFMYGYITHHITDSIFHPYIIYESGVYENTKESNKYKGKHELNESIIDSLVIDNINNIYKEIPKLKKLKELEIKVENIFKKVYNKDNYGKRLVNNMNNVRNFLKYYRCDPYKIKRVGYLIIDKITNKDYEFLSFNYPNKYKKFDINKKVIWHNPFDNKKAYSSINDLINKSINESLELILEIEQDLQNKKITEIQNISATHGYISKESYKIKIF